MAPLEAPARLPLEVLADPKEGERPAIAVYGNGMASVVSLAMLDVLDENKYLKNVAGYSAESGGVFDSVAAELGQIPMALELFTEVLPRDNFVSVRNLASRSPALMNLRGLTARLRTTHLLAIEAITNDPEILVGLSRMEDAKRLTVRLGDVPSEKRFDVMERSASVPLAAGKTALSTCDGGVLSPSPALAAAEAGYTHILLLANTPEEAAPWTENVFHRTVARRLAKKYGAPGVDIEQVMDEFSELFAKHSQDLREGKIGSSVVQVVRPQARKGLPSSFTCNPEILKRGAQEGRNAINLALDQPEKVMPLSESESQLFSAASLIAGVKKAFARRPEPALEPAINAI
jgi:hypothetical protein